MANLIDILINASWTGGGAIDDAKTGLRDMSNAAASSAVEMAVMREKSSALEFKLGELAREVGIGNITMEQATQQYQAAAETLGLVAEVAPEAGVNLADLAKKATVAGVALGVAAVAAKKIYAFIKEGAALELARDRFDRLAASIGTTGDELRGDLRIATQGLLTDMEAMAIATDFVAQGLATTHDEAVRLTGISAQLGLNMNQLLNTLTSKSTAGFDELGISVDGFAEKVDKLEAAGLKADEAFNLAFVEQAEAQIELVGRSAETTAGQLELLENRWTGFVDSVKLPIAELIGEANAFVLAGAITLNQAQRAVKDLASTKGDINEQNEEMERLLGLFQEFNIESKTNIFANYDLSGMEAVFTEAIGILAKTGGTTEELQGRLRELGFEVDDNGVKVGRLTVKWEEVYNAMEQLLIEDFQQKIGSATDSVGGLSEEMLKLREQVEAIEFKELLDNIGITSDEFIKLAYHMGGTAEATEYLEGVLESAEPINMQYAASLARIDEKMIAIGTTAAGLEKLMAPLFEERAELFRDFQLDLSDISQTEGENRASAEAQYEERRTDIVEQYGERRAQAEEDYQRRQVRNAAKLAGDIEDAQENSYERQAEIRENANQRFADLERDHADRLTDIIRDADDSLTEAAGRLDASAIVSITRRRERALEDEEQAYQRSHENIQRTLDEQLSAEQAASISRIADMQEYFAERQALDEEDHQLRLDRLEEANKDQLAVLEEKNAQELIEIQNAASLAQGLREIAYFQERTALGDHLGDKAKQEAQLQKDLLIAEEKWWKERTALIPDTTSAGASSLPANFFGTAGAAGPSISGDINIYIDGADGPEATGLSVRDELLGLFGSFTQ